MVHATSFCSLSIVTGVSSTVPSPLLILLYLSFTLEFRRTTLQPYSVLQKSALKFQLYKEQLYDLLATNKCAVDIREDGKVIRIPGLTEIPVSSVDDTTKCLMQVLYK